MSVYARHCSRWSDVEVNKDAAQCLTKRLDCLGTTLDLCGDRHRPDVMAGSEQAGLHSSKAATAPLQGPLVLTSVAGTASEALTNKLLHEHPAKFGTALKHTSRKPEKGEVEGVNFFFVKKEVLQKMIDAGQMAEWQEGAGGNLTGTALTGVQQVCSAVLNA